MKGEELSINEQLKEIKRSFRLMMNGVAAQSMRDKGLDYHVNWGASVPMLKAKAKEIGKNRDLAIALWKEDVRECKILATMIMPAEEMLNVVNATTADECFTTMAEEAENCLKNDGDCSRVVPMKHLILYLLRRSISCDAVDTVKKGLAGVNTDEEAVKILDSLPSHNCQIL